MKTPLSELIQKRMKELNLSRRDLVVAFGYSITSKGFRSLDNLLEGKTPTENWVLKISEILKVDKSEINRALNDRNFIFSMQKIKQKIQDDIFHRKNFEPSLVVITKNRGGFYDHVINHVYLGKEFMSIPDEEQVGIVKTKIQRHYEIVNGRTSAMSTILHYELRLDYDYKQWSILYFDTKGNMITNEKK